MENYIVTYSMLNFMSCVICFSFRFTQSRKIYICKCKKL